MTDADLHATLGRYFSALHECDAAIYGEAERLARAHLGRFGCAPAASAPREAELVPPHLRSSGRPGDPLAGPSLFARVGMQSS